MKKSSTKNETAGPVASVSYSSLLGSVGKLLEAARRASARAVNAFMTATYREVDLPFSLLSSDLPPEHEGHFTVEVHPAVAAWLWCKVDRPRKASWRYKTDRKVLLEMWEIVRAKLPGEARTREPKDDDEFDALVAYGLGMCWLKRDGTVGLLGNRAAGAFLVPASAALSRAYARFGDVDAMPPVPALQRTGLAPRR
jgi:hypothetical protein